MSKRYNPEIVEKIYGIINGCTETIKRYEITAASPGVEPVKTMGLQRQIKQEQKLRDHLENVVLPMFKKGQ
jgi:hypothetical protein